MFLSPEGAQYLAQQGVKLVGIDYLSLERGQPEHPSHKALLTHDIPILEGIRLAHVAPGSYKMID